jgi:hypothetical protein
MSHHRFTTPAGIGNLLNGKNIIPEGLEYLLCPSLLKAGPLEQIFSSKKSTFNLLFFEELSMED